VNGGEIRWVSAALTDVGKVRKINEDACAAWPDNGIWVVADGMGGHDAGDLASSSIVEALGRIDHQSSLSDMVDRVDDALIEVNRALLAEAATRGEDTTIGSTVVVVLACGRHCACLWAGDSRIYRLRDGRLRQISQDHSQVMDMVEQGLILREDAESHPAANVVTRAVGAAQELFMDVEVEELNPGDRYLLCSDGLTKEVQEPEIAQYMQQGSCSDVCDRLVGLTLERGSRDNVSVVVIDFN
jgi:serine/threonine protein phosphatase Stp1